MNDGGVLSQWLHTYEMDGTTLASILRAMAKTFPDYAIYSTIDADIVIIARKGGPAGSFQREIVDWPGMRPVIERLGLGGDVIERRMIASWRAVEPVFLTYGVAANSDFFPIVDYRGSKTRFTRERAEMLSELQLSPIPMLEMLDAAKRGNHERGVAPRNAVVESARQVGWTVRDVVMSGSAREFDPQIGSMTAPAYIVHSWATSCPADVSFDALLPYLQAIAQNVNPHVPPAAASQMWAWIAGSPCGKRLAAADRAWIDLFASIGQRDAPAMVVNAKAVLQSTQGAASPATETALLAAAVGLVCAGEPRQVDALLTQNARRFFRKNERESELRYLLGLSGPSFKARAPNGPCTSAGAGDRDRVTSSARRSP